MRKLLLALVVLIVAAVGIYVAAGSVDGPAITVAAPQKYVGLSTPLEVVVKAPGARLSGVTVEFEQHSTRTPLFTFHGGDITSDSHVRVEGGDTIHITTMVGRDVVKGLRSGPGRIVVNAVRPVLFGIRKIPSSRSHDVDVRLEKPRISVLSTKHYIHAGGSEMIVYRVTPDDVVSGVSVGNLEYPGYQAAGATVDGVPAISDPAVRIAFFALRYDQDVDTPIRLFAKDPAGNSATSEFDHRTFPNPFKNSKIQIDDAFIDKVVMRILETTTEVKAGGTPLESFLAVNGDLRKKNAEKIASFALESAPEMLWKGVVFHPFSNTAVEAAFADRRTYIYQGREVDKQTHLGFDLASVANTPIVAANRGKVVFADMLGIYGNCVIIDHGMGVQSLYAHLSSIGVKAGDTVQKEQQIGRSGMTGMAAGDHLHFTMLINGQMVNPIEWWDGHWIEDRILRKLREANGASPSGGQ
jgi:murein DD-endopeptidase MepM/ murein hydrolase activator NlpD